MEQLKACYSPRETGRIIGLSAQSVYDRIKDGSIPARRLGTRLVVPSWWLREFMEKPEPSRSGE